MTTKLGGVTLAEPKWEHGGLETRGRDIGVVHEMADGSLKYDYVASRKEWRVRWEGLTSTEKSTIETRYLVKSTQSWEPPDGGTFTVVTGPDSYRETYEDYPIGRRYRVELILLEVTT